MRIYVPDIAEEGLRLREPAALGPVFTEEGFTLEGVDLLVMRRGAEVEVAGTFSVTARLACSRCLEPVSSTVAPDVDLRLRPCPPARHEEVELGPDDLEIDFYREDTLDLGGLIRSEAQLALPMKPLCGPECRGLCPKCGANRNLTPCACETRRTDPRLAVLEAFRTATDV
jgi:uncharacterized protein